MSCCECVRVPPTTAKCLAVSVCAGRGGRRRLYAESFGGGAACLGGRDRGEPRPLLAGRRGRTFTGRARPAQRALPVHPRPPLPPSVPRARPRGPHARALGPLANAAWLAAWLPLSPPSWRWCADGGGTLLCAHVLAACAHIPLQPQNQRPMLRGLQGTGGGRMCAGGPQAVGIMRGEEAHGGEQAGRRHSVATCVQEACM